METLVQPIFALLTTDTGSLAFHLVLAFSALGSLQLCLSYSQRGLSTGLRRTAVGLSALLALQIGLFVLSGLGWQGVLDAGRWLPFVDRAATLFALVLIVWLWAFPESSPAADAALILVELLVVTATVLGTLWWLEQDPALTFNHSQPDVIAQVAALVLTAIGVLVLATRRPAGWVLGLYMILLMAAGHVVYLLMPPVKGDYAGVVRLGQVAAYFFLLMLPQRVAVFPGTPEQPDAIAATRQESEAATDKDKLYANPKILQALSKLVMETEPEQVCRVIVSTLARNTQSDLCLLVMPPDEQGEVRVRCGYDQLHGRYLEDVAIDSRGLPVLTAALRMGRVRRLNMNSTSPDLASLMRAFDLERSGNLLFLPALAPDGQPIASIILFSAHSGQDWNSEEQSFLGTLTRLMVHFLQRSQEVAGLRQEFDQVRQAARLSQDRARLVLEERQKLEDQLAVVREDSRRDRAQLAGLAEMTAAQIAAQEAVERLRAENEELSLAVQQASEAAAKQERSYEAQLRQALEEVAILRTSLVEADKKISALKAAQTGLPLSNGQLEAIVNVAQDLRQPLSSIVGYVDFLLSEVMGILGAQQRKHLERIKVSTERMSRMVDDLIQAASSEGNIAQLALEEVELAGVLQGLAAGVDGELRQRQIALQVELPEQPMLVSADQRALSRIFTNLLHNAGAVTPKGGDVSLVARLESTDGDQGYVLVQIADSGGGIDPQDLPRVFSPQATNDRIRGLGSNGADLPGIRTLVEVLGGRIWVDSEPGQGATFSVLLPLAGSTGIDFLDEGVLV